MRQPALFRQIKKQYQRQATDRKTLIVHANDALTKSKRAIFALHRDDRKKAERLLSEAQKQFQAIEKMFRRLPQLKEEGSYRAALEEYAEATLFFAYLKGDGIDSVDDRAKDAPIYLAGLSDFTGELVRYATRQVTLGNIEVVHEVTEIVKMVIEFMLDLDLTGYQRNKFDQAKKNLSRLEQMTYDLAIRARG